MNDLRRSHEVVLPSLVERTITLICEKRNQTAPNQEVRQMLAALGERKAYEIVARIQNSPGPVRNLNSLIRHRVENAFLQLQQQGYPPSASGGGDPGNYSSSPHSSGGGTVSSAARPSGTYFSPPSTDHFPAAAATTYSSPPFSSSAAGASSGTYSPRPSSAVYPSPPAAPSATYHSPPAAPFAAAYPSPSAAPSAAAYPSSPPFFSAAAGAFSVAGPSSGAYSPRPSAAVYPSPPAAPSFPFPDASADGGGCSSSGAGNFGTFLWSNSGDIGTIRVNRRLPFDEDDDFSRRKTSGITNNLLMILDQLEFRKFFLLLCYLGRHKLEEILNLDDAQSIARMKDIPMSEFEPRIWREYGTRCLKAEDRLQCAQWDSGKTHLYNCDVYQDGSFTLKGPCLTTTRTHLQRSLGDHNVLIVKFIGDDIENANIVSTEGILVGLKRFHFFAFKDESQDKKKKDKIENGTRLASKNAKCYFVNLDSISQSGMNEVCPFPLRNVAEARCLFMHIHMVSTMAKYMARFSLILSNTIKFPVDLSSVSIEIIEDIPCRDENGIVVHGEDGKQLIHTDGTGFISEDLARLCPQDFGNAKFIKDFQFQKLRDVIGLTDIPSDGGSGFEALNWEPPLLMQCRLFSKGLAVKGTLLLNKKLRRTIQVRPSMVKVERDEYSMMLPVQTFDSLEIVAVSHKPRRAYLSRNLIALLSYGGVPRNFFLNLLANALNDTNLVFSDMRAAMKVSVLYGEMDDDYTAARMIGAGVPLNEPHLQDRLSKLANLERNQLKTGKLPITESFYLMGTTDPTGVLNSNEVCVILENGPISGKVLVYRNPGLHFGDIHVMEAVYIKDLEGIIGNSKYGIFFSIKGRRSAAAEMGNGDFDGDLYWVSRNPQLLRDFRASEPWSRVYPTPPTVSKKPSDYPSEEKLEAELFRQFKKARNPSPTTGIAADSWLSFMDRLLTEENPEKRENLKNKLRNLIDIYYDAIDAPKSGKKINIPPYLIANEFPHYKGNGQGRSYVSESILGEMYNIIQQFESKGSEEGIWKIPFFEQCLQTRTVEPFLNLWRKRYEDYRKEMTGALQTDDKDSRNANANEVVRKYKLLLYGDGAEEFYESRKDSVEIYNEALAIYHLSYNCAIQRNERSKCGFAWKVAGPALCKLLAFNQNEIPILILPSVQKAIL